MAKSNHSKKTSRKVKSCRKAATSKLSSKRQVANSSEAVRVGSKVQQIVTLLRRPSGATIDQLTAATGWLSHSVRGAISGSLKKKLGLAVVSDKADGPRVYRLAAA